MKKRAKENYKGHLSLTIFVSAIVFGILLVTIFLSAAIVYLLFRTGLLTQSDMSPNLLQVLSFTTLISLLIGAAITFLTSRVSLKAVNNIITKMDKLASGNFQIRVRLTGPLRDIPAFAEVADSFNKMAEELESTEMLRSDFINNFSHEFKTPIVSIAGFAKVLKRSGLTDAEKAEYVDIIEEESLRLAAMATNVLNLTKVESQTILTDLSVFNLSEQIRSSILLLEHKWVPRDLDFDLELSEFFIQANEELLKQVWINLLDNAVKFSPHGAVVAIGVLEEAESYLVSITNPGPEIPPGQQKKIFRKFYQADESHASAGNGIGLAIVKRVVELHGGNVSVHCADGKITFTTVLPKRCA